MHKYGGEKGGVKTRFRTLYYIYGKNRGVYINYPATSLMFQAEKRYHLAAIVLLI